MDPGKLMDFSAPVGSDPAFLVTSGGVEYYWYSPPYVGTILGPRAHGFHLYYAADIATTVTVTVYFAVQPDGSGTPALISGKTYPLGTASAVTHVTIPDVITIPETRLDGERIKLGLSTEDPITIYYDSVATPCVLNFIPPPPPPRGIWNATSNPSAGEDWAMDVAVDSTGVYVVGYDQSLGDFEWRIEKRSLTDGSLIPSFGTTGVIRENPSTVNDEAYGIAVDSTGIYIVGNDVFPGRYEWRIEKRSLADGSLIPSFGTGGIVTSDPSPRDDYAYSAAIDDTGIYIVGSDESLGSGDRQWRIEKRSLTDGSLIWSRTSHPYAGDNQARDVAIDSSGAYIVGYEWPAPSDYKWRVEKRSLTDGSLISSFGTGGVVTSDPSADMDQAYGVAVDATGVYIVGYDRSPPDPKWRIEKRSLTNGALISSFGTGGVVTADLSFGEDWALDVAVDGTGVYVVGYDYSLGDREWRIQKRSLADGSLMWEKTSNPSTREDTPHAVAVHGTSVYVVGSDESVEAGDFEWRIERLYSAPADFSIGAEPSSISVAQGSSGSSTINITSMYGFGEAVGLSYSWFGSAPGGVTVSLPGPVTPLPDDSATSGLQVSASGTATVGTFTLRVTGSSGATSKSVDISVQITEPATPTPTPTPRAGCIIATAAYGSELAPEVTYMRHVRDEMIGSNQIGRLLVNWWNAFYYSWSPPIAQLVARCGPLQPVSQVFLLPLVGVTHSAALIHTLIAPISPASASIVAFLSAASLSTTIYVVFPLLTLRTLYRKRRLPKEAPRE